MSVGRESQREIWSGSGSDTRFEGWEVTKENSDGTTTVEVWNGHSTWIGKECDDLKSSTTYGRRS